MGKTRRIVVDGEEVSIDEDEDIGRLKTLAGASERGILTFSPPGPGAIEALEDDAKVSEIPENVRASFQPIRGPAFGSRSPPFFNGRCNSWIVKELLLK